MRKNKSIHDFQSAAQTSCVFHRIKGSFILTLLTWTSQREAPWDCKLGAFIQLKTYWSNFMTSTSKLRSCLVFEKYDTYGSAPNWSLVISHFFLIQISSFKAKPANRAKQDQCFPRVLVLWQLTKLLGFRERLLESWLRFLIFIGSLCQVCFCHGSAWNKSIVSRLCLWSFA